MKVQELRTVAYRHNTHTQIYTAIHTSHKQTLCGRNTEFMNVTCNGLSKTTISNNRLVPSSTNRVEKKTVRSYVTREVLIMTEKRRQPELTPRYCSLVFKELDCCYHQRKFPRHYSSLLMGHTRRMRVLMRAGQQTIHLECQGWRLAFDTSLVNECVKFNAEKELECWSVAVQQFEIVMNCNGSHGFM